ncbi:hypothetical protein SM124_07560 [Bacillus sp. 31A1R]|uniref:Uncharacterized protein n=1 Tax=Robertmurraya mangrovi TaxID=3098077 RepID=A0ABU5IWQ7_9BACI|nr:hypothetical protein [Bacillus sp. 31A1R]MDZ5471603.1 hypothetical protein [Bacillus sp. 31A1R]
MKSKYFGITALLVILMLNIIFTQKMVHQYYFENYTNSIILAGLNILLFPIAILIFKKDQKGVK